jgi:hypothetical protein
MNKKQFIVLMGKRRDVLPAGFTALEYLESSGTQFIELPEVFRIAQDDTPKSGIRIRSKDYKLVNGNYIFNVGVIWNSTINTYLYCGMRNTTNNALSMGADGRNHFPSPTYEEGEIYTAEINFLDSGIAKWNDSTRANFWGGATAIRSTSTTLMKNCTCKLVDASLSSGAEITRELIPVLNADGAPGMYDKVSKTFFGNQGTGTFGYRIKGAPATFALRDPHRVAPSGIYARLIAENEIELIADTEEVTGEGWEWFSNTAEAYEHFNIVPSGANEL